MDEVIVKAKTNKDSQFEIRLNGPDGKLLIDSEISGSEEWQTKTVSITEMTEGVQDIYLINTGDTPLTFDWIQFE